MSTILINKGYLLDPHMPFERKDILIEGDLISQIATNIDFKADTIIDASDKVIIPGLITAHTHTFGTPVRGLVDMIPTEPWLLYSQKHALGLIYAQHGMDNKASLRDLYTWCAIGAVELLKTGTTSLVEMGPTLINPIDFDKQVDAVANAFIDTGIRAAISPMYWDLKFSEFLPLHLLSDLKPEDIAQLNEPPLPKANDIIQALRSFLRRWRGRNSRISVGLGPREADICSRELMEQTVEIASEFDASLQTHLLAMKSRVIVGNKMFNQPVVKYLNSINFLGPRTSFAHAI
jgi:cytosine/adenosine deaminase-related metal-dependent hydrolase